MPARPQNSPAPVTLPAAAYWAENDERRAQRFYVLLCLALTSIHDRFIAGEERQRGNLNWAATMAYYSIVHAARCLCFQGLGNFHTDHGAVASFLRDRACAPFDWLHTFVTGERLRRDGERISDAFQTLSTHLTNLLGARSIDADLRTVGELLDAARPLRNDANYEALLIAHEQHHAIVEPLVADLGNDLTAAARWVGDLLADAVVAEVDRGPNVPDVARPAYRRLAQEHFGFRMDSWIGQKLSGESRATFQQFAERLRFVGETADSSALDRYILHPAFGGAFDSKRGLMRRYQDRAHDFHNLVANLAPRGNRLTPALGASEPLEAESVRRSQS